MRLNGSTVEVGTSIGEGSCQCGVIGFRVGNAPQLELSCSSSSSSSSFRRWVVVVRFVEVACEVDVIYMGSIGVEKPPVALCNRPGFQVLVE